MSEMREGVIKYTTGFDQLVMTVREGKVVECDPPREWPVGLDAVDLWNGGEHWGVGLEWIDLSGNPYEGHEAPEPASL